MSVALLILNTIVELESFGGFIELWGDVFDSENENVDCSSDCDVSSMDIIGWRLTVLVASGWPTDETTSTDDRSDELLSAAMLS